MHLDDNNRSPFLYHLQLIFRCFIGMKCLLGGCLVVSRYVLCLNGFACGVRISETKQRSYNAFQHARIQKVFFFFWGGGWGGGGRIKIPL